MSMLCGCGKLGDESIIKSKGKCFCCILKENEENAVKKKEMGEFKKIDLPLLHLKITVNELASMLQTHYGISVISVNYSALKGGACN